MTGDDVPITWTDESLQPRAAAIAERFNLPLGLGASGGDDPRLVLSPQGLLLCAGSTSSGCDFLGGSLGHRLRTNASGRAEALVKAVLGRRNQSDPTPLSVIDATAGLGRDSVMLAMAGCHVTAVERHPAVAALFDDGWSRAIADADFSRRLNTSGGRLNLLFADAADLIPQLPVNDVIYLDPMFPPRDKSALVKKQMQLLQHLLGPHTNDDRLLDVALAHAQRKVVVKRPRSAPPLADRAPTFTRTGPSIRFDIYQRPSSNT